MNTKQTPLYIRTHSPIDWHGTNSSFSHVYITAGNNTDSPNEKYFSNYYKHGFKKSLDSKRRSLSQARSRVKESEENLADYIRISSF